MFEPNANPSGKHGESWNPGSQMRTEELSRLLLLALESDSTAQSEYSRKRQIDLKALPSWVEADAVHIVQKHLAAFEFYNFMSDNKLRDLNKARLHGLRIPYLARHLHQIHLYDVRSIEQWLKEKALYEKKEYKPLFGENELWLIKVATERFVRGSAVGAGKSIIRKTAYQLDTFTIRLNLELELNPDQWSPLARVAAAAHKEITRLLSGGQILHDYLTMHGLQLSRHKFLRVLGQVSSPWEIVGGKEFRKLSSLIAAYHEPDSELRLLPLSKYLESCIDDSDHLAAAARLLENHKRRESLRVQKEKTDATPTTGVSRTRLPSTEEVKAARLDIILQTASQQNPGLAPKEAKEYSRMLVKLASGLVGLARVVKDLESGVAPEELIYQLRMANRAPPEKSEVPKPTSEQVRRLWQMLNAELPMQVEFSLRYPSVEIREQFESWLNSHANSRERVELQLNQFTKGRFGDHKKITSGEGLFECRLFTEGGVRIYFVKTLSRGEVVLLRIGQKDDQINDIELARSTLKRFRSDAQASE